MPDDLLTYVIPMILIGLIGLMVGAVSGYLIAGLLHPAQPPAPKPPRGLVEAARLWRDKRSGQLVVEMDEQLAGGVGELNARQRAIVERLAHELWSWLGRPAPAANAPAPVAPQAKPAAAQSAPIAPAAPAAQQPLVVPPAAPLLGVEVAPVSTDLGTIITRAGGSAKGREADAPPRSIAQQVDEIVQERLPGSPFSERVITVRDHPRIGIVVFVDNQQFEGVGDVADPQVREFLRSCVAEWERRAGK
ncbi:MAG: hypothetical protein ACKOC5_10320 [Chloroflexota bacterium]